MAAIPTEVESTIRKLFIPKLSDNISHHTYLMERMWAKKIVQVGGDGFEQPVEYDLNPNVGTYRKHGVFRRVPKEIATKSIISWADYYLSIPFSGKELRENAGKDGVTKLIDLAKMRIQNGEKALKDRLCYDLYSDGTEYEWPADSGEILYPLTGLRGIVAQDRDYGGIDSSDTGQEWWDSQAFACQGGVIWKDLYDSADLDYLPKIADTLLADTNIGSDQVTLILCDEVTWGAWHVIARSKESILKSGNVGRGKANEGKKGAFLGFEALFYRNVPIVADYYCPAGYMFFLNEDHIYMKSLAGADMSYDPPAEIVGEDTLLAKTLLSTNLNCDAPRSCGVVTGLPTTRTLS